VVLRFPILMGAVNCRATEAKQLPFFYPGHWPQTELSACLSVYPGSCKEKQILGKRQNVVSVHVLTGNPI